MRAVDGDVEPADPGQRAARDDDVVEGDVAGRRRSAVPPRRIRPSSAIRSSIVKSPVDDLGEHLVELAGLGLRQEADLAEVDAEDRDVDLGDGPSGAQERAVAAEDDEGVGRREFADEGLAGRPTGACQWSMPRTWHQPAARALSSTAASIVGL